MRSKDKLQIVDNSAIGGLALAGAGIKLWVRIIVVSSGLELVILHNRVVKSHNGNTSLVPTAMS